MCNDVTWSAVSEVAPSQLNLSVAATFEWPLNGLPSTDTENVIVFSVNFSGLVKWNTFSWLSPPRSVLSAAVPSTVKVSTVPTRDAIFKSLNVR